TRRSSDLGADHALVKTQNPSWKALVLTFIWLARTSPPTRILCLPRIMSNESEIVKTLVPPVKGENPRSPRDQKPPPGSVEVNPQLMPPRFAPGMPSFCDSQVSLPKDRILLKIRL